MISKRRLRLCRWGFLLLCVVPTIVVATGIALPNRCQPWEDLARDQTGLVATIGEVSHPEPNATLLQKVVLADPDVGVVAKLRAVEIDGSDKTFTFSLTHPEIRADRLDRVCRAIQQRALRKRPLLTGIEAYCRQLTLLLPAKGAKSPSPIATLSDVKCRITATAKGNKFDLRFSLAGSASASPCRLTIERQSSGNSEPSVAWQIATHDCFVPCRVLSSVFPPLDRLGPDCQFRGSIQGVTNRQGWTGSVQGEFTEIDLYRLVQEQFLHTLEGAADVTLTELKFHNSQIVVAKGRLRGQRGTIGNSLLAAAAEHLGCRSQNNLAGTATRYRVIDFSFDVLSDRVALRGNCKAQPTTMIEGVLGEPLLDEPKHASRLAALARTLVPHRDVQVPLTRETSKLLSLFPIPTLQGKQSQAPRAVLRLD